jgi:predicted metalloprotease with PDZ domain
MNYSVYYQQPHKRIIELVFSCKVFDKKTTICLPSWRPGRYELGNFAKNILHFNPVNAKGQSLPYRKIKKDVWEIDTFNETELIIKYSVFTPELNAGSCWIDEHQLYVNGIHCFLYNPALINNPCQLTLYIPQNFITAIALPMIEQNTYNATNYHELVDSPFICSPTLKHLKWEQQSVCFNLWFQGIQDIPANTIIADFKKFIDEQINLFGEFVSDEYHFLFQLPPYKHYHGVEHLKSTVITIGPVNEVFKYPLYNEFLGISCHELFHCWNVKTIRPAEMLPYRYQEENYSKLGYVAEGVTTYYGDYLLLRSNVFNWNEFALCFNEWLNKHFENEGRFNLSVSDSSFDTWLDGYVPGVPGRKVSIYNEGALCAFILDILIRKYTQNKRSLDDVMKTLYEQKGKTHIGYTAKDYRTIAEQVAGKSLCNYFDLLINGTHDYTPYLIECLHYLGLNLSFKPNQNFLERELGIKLLPDETSSKIKLVAKNSPADFAKIPVGSSLISINQIPCTAQNLDKINALQIPCKLKLELNCFGYHKFVEIQADIPQNYFPIAFIEPHSDATFAQKENFNYWAKSISWESLLVEKN